jgi:quercetin dioxygenase-like cupin family protein
MRRLSLNIVMVLMGLIFIGTNGASAQNKMKKEEVIKAAEDLKWEQLKGAPPGVMSAKLWGDNTVGAYGGLTKFPAGFKSPLHYHSHDVKIVVIKGAYSYKGVKYGPGSYVFIPGGERHISGGVDDSETIFFIEQPGKFDVKPIEPPKEKK